MLEPKHLLGEEKKKTSKKNCKDIVHPREAKILM